MDTIKEVRESGNLELYVMGLLDEQARIEVERALVRFPELTKDIQAIEHSLYQYAKTTAIQPSAGLRSKVIDSVKGNPPSGNSSFGFLPGLLSLLGILSLFGLATMGYLYYMDSGELEDLKQEYQALQENCDSIQQSYSIELEMLREMQNPNRQIALLSPTDKYPSTALNFILNRDNQVAYIQTINMPELENDQSFQLWSLKEGQDPIPLDVFEISDQGVLKVQFEEGTQNYAITIEPRGGSESPTLENLIGVIPVA